LAARRGKKRALIAVGHSILKSVYHILKGKEEYKELGAGYLDGKTQIRRTKYLRQELEKLGYTVELSLSAGIATANTVNAQGLVEAAESEKEGDAKTAKIVKAKKTAKSIKTAKSTKTINSVKTADVLQEAG